MPFPPPRWRPGKRLAFSVLTPGYDVVHVRGVGTERLMFDIYHDNERLHVYGRKYPMIDMPVVKKQGVRTAVAGASVTHYLPQTDDAAPLFVSQGQALLRATAESALRELRASQVPSFAYPGKLLADTVLPDTLVTLAVIEQTDDGDFASAPAAALNKTVGQYGLMQSQAFTYSVSRANAAGPMQFTDKRGRVVQQIQQLAGAHHAAFGVEHLSHQPAHLRSHLGNQARRYPSGQLALQQHGL